MSDFSDLLAPALLRGVAMALGASLLALPIAVALGYALARHYRTMTGRIILAIALVPLLLSPVLIGTMLGQILGGGWLFTPIALILGHMLAIIPWMSLICWRTFNNQPRQPQNMVHSLGLSRREIFWQMSLPAARPALGLAFVVGGCLALTETGFGLMLGGNIPGQTQNPGLLLYQSLNSPSLPDGFALLCGFVLMCGVASLAIITSLISSRPRP